MSYGMQNSQGPAAAKAGTKLQGGFTQGQMPLYTPEQSQLFQQQFAHTGPDSHTGRLAAGDQSYFNEIEAPALRQFSGIQGNIASRFSGQGMGGRRSSGFQHEMNAKTSDFAQDLASKRMGLQRQAIQDLMGMSNQILNQKPYENYAVKKQPKQSFWQKLMGGVAPIAGAIGGGFLGGPMGASAGAQLGNAFGSGFSGQESPGMDFSGLSGLSNSWNQGNALKGAYGQRQPSFGGTY